MILLTFHKPTHSAIAFSYLFTYFTADPTHGTLQKPWDSHGTSFALLLLCPILMGLFSQSSLLGNTLLLEGRDGLPNLC